MTMAWGIQIDFVSEFMFVVLNGLYLGDTVCYFLGERNTTSSRFHNDRHEKRWVSLRHGYLETEYRFGTHASYAAFFTNPLYPTYKN
jgi:hypothetical protein